MFSIKSRFTRLSAGLVLTTVVALSAALPAFADQGSVVLTGGALAVTTAPGDVTFAPKQLTGVTQTTNGTVGSFTVTDARGSGAGWIVQVQASRFTSTTVATHKLDAGSLSMTKPSVAADGTTSAAPSVDDGPFVIDNGSPQTIATADTDAGMGVYNFGVVTPSVLTLTLKPNQTYAETYTSNLTVSAIVAP